MRWRLALVAGSCFAIGFAAAWAMRRPPAAPAGSSSFDAARQAHDADRWRAIWRLGETRPTFVMLGDSLTATPQWHELTGCPSLVNRGLYSDTTASLLRRTGDVVALRPRAAFLLIGVNDVRQGRSPEEIAANLRAIVVQLRAAGIAVYLSPILPVGTGDRGDPAATNVQIAGANTAIAAALEGLAVTTIDLRPRVTGADGRLRPELTHDGLHLKAAGYALWRDAILPIVNEHCVVAGAHRP